MDVNTIRIIFIIPQEYENESSTSELMQKAFEACKENNINAHWYKENDKTIEYSKTDFVIFEKFEGDFFEYVVSHSKSARVIGPMCFLVCLTEGRSIPNFSWPIFNVAMHECIVTCSHIAKDMKKLYKSKIQSMAGIYADNLVTKCTHLITDSVITEKYIMAAEAGMQLVTPDWIEAVWNESQVRNVKATDDQFSKYKCPTFYGLTICSTGITNTSKRREIENLITENGGKYVAALRLSKTDILICEGLAGATSEKFKAARKVESIRIVTVDWIYDSIKSGYALRHTDYQVKKKGTSTPTKENENVDPDFSVMSAINFPGAQATIQDSINVSNITYKSPSALTITNMKRKADAMSGHNDLVDTIDIKKVKQAGAFLDGCGVYLVGFGPTQHEKLSKVLNFSGATRYDDLSDRITHIIIGDKNCNDLKVIASKRPHAALVSVHWLLESLEKMNPASEFKHAVDLPSNLRDECSSPLSKKSLSLLRNNNTVIEEEVNVAENVPVVQQNTENELDIIQKYWQDEGSQDTLMLMMQEQENKQQQNDETIKNSRIQNGADSTLRNEPSNKTGIPEPESTLGYSEECSSQPLDIFEGLKFSIIGFEEEEYSQLKDYIEELSGTVVPKNYKGIVNYEVVPVFTSEHYQTNSELVNDLWISECYSERKISDVEYFHRPIKVKQEVQPLFDCVITISSYTGYERGFLKSLIVRLGGICQEQLAKNNMPKKGILSTTHLVTKEPSGKKYCSAVMWKLPIVNKDWLVECARLGKKVDAREFSVEETGEDGFIVPGSAVKQKNFALDITSDKNKTTETHTPINKILNFNETSPHTPIQKVTEPSTSTNLQGTAERQRTPANFSGASQSPCSQVTPVRKLMEQFGFRQETPPTPKALTHIDTPETPYGAFIRPNPSPRLRKEMLAWLNTLPEWKPPKPRRPSTPLSELRRQLWAKLGTNRDSQEENVPPNDCVDNNDDGEAINNIDKTAQATTPISKKLDFSADTPESAVAEKLKQLEEMVKASGGSRRSSVRKVQEYIPDPVPLQVERKESQVYTVGWDYTASQTSTVTAGTGKLFMLSGIAEEERKLLVRQLESLGAKVSDNPSYDPESTHLICAKPARNEKTLACIAAGKWILHVSYVEESLKAGKLLDEELFEFGNPKSSKNVSMSSSDTDTTQRVHGMKWWRKEISKRGHGAFSDMRAIVVANKREQIAKIVEAGGGMVVDVKPPFSDSVYATHCLLDTKNVTDLAPYIPLAKQGIYCVSTLYISEVLQKSAKDIRDCILPYFLEFYTDN